MMKLPDAWIHVAKWSVCGASDSSPNAWRAWRNSLDRAVPGLFPPEVVVQIKALACELPSQHQSRWRAGVCPRSPAMRFNPDWWPASCDTTVWRWLHQDAIRPWQHRCWIFPRDPDFAAKAGRLLDLYEGVWQDQPLREDEFVLSADEKTSIHLHRVMRMGRFARMDASPSLEHEYERRGAWAYLAAWDVHQAKVFGRCEAQSGIAPFDRLVEQVMGQSPYKSARRVFWIVDNGSSHRGHRAVTRLQNRYANLTLVHGPVHASWLNQIEIYFSILQQKVLTPNEFPSLAAVADRLGQFERHYEQIAQPFQWHFTRRNLNDWLDKLAQQDRQQSEGVKKFKFCCGTGYFPKFSVVGD